MEINGGCRATFFARMGRNVARGGSGGVVEMIRDKLIPCLLERFPEAKPRFGVPPKPVVVFPAKHPDVGDIEIFDDGSELTVVAGKFTHGHFADYGSSSEEESAQKIIENVVSFLENLFADQVVLWGAHRESGGWCYRDKPIETIPEIDKLKRGRPLYVWSGLLRGDESAIA
jgi:hypothetical protein